MPAKDIFSRVSKLEKEVRYLRHAVATGGGGTTSTSTTTSTSSSTTTTTTTVAFEAEAQAYFAAVEGTGATIDSASKTAWNNYVLREKAAGRYTKKKLVLPYLGGTAAAHAIDAISATSKVTWNGTITHNGSGVKGDGSTGYGVLAWNPSTNFTTTNCGGGIYMRTDEVGGYDFGIMPNSGAGAFGLIVRSSGGNEGASFMRGVIGAYNSGIDALVNPDHGPGHAGWNAVNKVSNTSLSIHRNGATLDTDTGSNAGTLVNGNIHLLNLNITDAADGLFTARQQGLFELWEGYTEADVNGQNTSVETLMDDLSRGVQ
jgi:hypothetical protein